MIFSRDEFLPVLVEIQVARYERLLVNDTYARPVGSATLRVVRRMNVPEEMFFRLAPGYSVLYRRALYCPREDGIKFRMIVLSHLRRHLSFGDRDVSITWSHLLLPAAPRALHVGECVRANKSCALRETRAFLVTDRKDLSRLHNSTESHRFSDIIFSLWAHQHFFIILW